MKPLIIILSIASLMIMVHSCLDQNPQKQNSEKEIEEIKDHAQQAIANTFGALSGRLKAELTEGGVQQAIEYCNLNAIMLTDSLAHQNNVSIKRATNRPRNGSNKLNYREQVIFNNYLDAIANDLPYSDTLVIDSNKRIYYKPILINELCLKCHGDKEIMEDYHFIKEKYPNDQATGYKLNELRGIWSVAFDSDNQKVK